MEPAFATMSAAPLSRRGALSLAGLSVAGLCLSRPSPAHALKPGRPSRERLLAGTREEKTPEELEAERERIAEEKRLRLERQRELQASAERRKAGLEEAPTNTVEIESSLRGQYYYPTARKRYLPRVKLAWDTLPAVEGAARDNRWPVVADLSKEELADAVLPMRLYASSLAGGGLNIGGKFIENMNAQAETYEKALKKLSTAVKRRQTDVALSMLGDMKGAMENYRRFGHLEAADFGIGEVPKDTKVGSGFSNNNAALYKKNKSFAMEVDPAAGA